MAWKYARTQNLDKSTESLQSRLCCLWVQSSGVEDWNKTCKNSSFCPVRVRSRTSVHHENPVFMQGSQQGGESNGICSTSYSSMKSPNLDSLGMSWSLWCFGLEVWTGSMSSSSCRHRHVVIITSPSSSSPSSSPSSSKQHDVGMVMSWLPWRHHHVTIVMSRSSCRHRLIVIIMSPSSCRDHHVAITPHFTQVQYQIAPKSDLRSPEHKHKVVTCPGKPE